MLLFLLRNAELEITLVY